MTAVAVAPARPRGRPRGRVSGRRFVAGPAEILNWAVVGQIGVAVLVDRRVILVLLGLNDGATGRVGWLDVRRRAAA